MPRVKYSAHEYEGVDPLVPSDVHLHTLGKLVVEYNKDLQFYKNNPDEYVDACLQANAERVEGWYRDDQLYDDFLANNYPDAESHTPLEITDADILRWDLVERRTGLHLALLDVHSYFAALPDQEREKLDAYMNRSAPVILHADKFTHAQEESWADYLSDIPKKMMISFLKSHIEKLASQQESPDVAAAIVDHRAAYKTRVKEAVEAGKLSSSVARFIDKVDEVKVYIGDYFDTILQDRGGYHQWGSGHIVISAEEALNKDGSVNEHFYRIATHEDNHAILGKLGRRWLNEALTEHITQALLHGEWDVIDPYLRSNDRYIYNLERILLHELLNPKNGGSVPAALATRAYSSHDIEERNVFEAAVNKAWGVTAESGGAILLLSNHVSRLEDKHQKPGLSKRVVQDLALGEAISDLRQQSEVIFGAARDKVAA